MLQSCQAWVQVVLLAGGVLLAGCATRKIDWTGRVGTYTFDQSVLEFGPPDKQAKLSDGTVVAEWVTRRGHSYIYAAPAYHPYRHGGYYHTPYVDTHAPDYFLRLTFDAAGRLRAWERFAR